MNFKDLLCQALPVMEKASPLIAGLLDSPKSMSVISLLALLVNCDPRDQEEIAERLNNDADLYAKMKKMESTHGKWLYEQ